MPKILIAEDEKAIGRALSNKVRAEGYDVILVEDGVAALAELKKNKYDLVIVDLIMARLDGFKLLEELQSLSEKPPVVVFSNLAQDSDRDRAIQLGAAGFYIKAHTSLSEISNIIKKHIR